MIASSPIPRRGVALILVLAALVLTVSAASLTARSATTRSLSATIRVREAMADDLAQSAEQAIEAWLETLADKVVLPPNAASPEVPVIDDHWDAESGPVGITITAWDQCGMIPRSLAGKAGGFMTLPVPDGVAWLGAAIPGLDLSTSEDSAFPAAGVTNAPGALVATHNPLPVPPSTSPAPAVINVHTASASVLREAYRHLGLSGEELVLTARGKGEQSAVPRPPNTRRADTPRDLVLTGSSGAWSFRIDAEVAGVRRSWWCVYTRREGRWDLEQRLAIRD